ncbi:PfkB family carbohydrate kinase [Vibrio chagasii]|nr:PfkB family carbohydrate kinase [Vibrio chagasii]
MGATDRFIRVDGATRINVESGRKLRPSKRHQFPRCSINADAIKAFEETLLELAEDHEYFVIAGSLPQGVSPELCASWVQRLRDPRPCFSTAAVMHLKLVSNAQPWLIKPNDEELSQLFNAELTTRDQCPTLRAEAKRKGIDNIVVSLGAEGVMA